MADYEELLSMDELAARLGVTTQAVRQAMREDDLPGRKVGSRWFFAWSEIIYWIGRGTWASEKGRRAGGHGEAGQE